MPLFARVRQYRRWAGRADSAADRKIVDQPGPADPGGDQ